MDSYGIAVPFAIKSTYEGEMLVPADALDALLSVLADFTGPDDCSYDHHGYCQAHGWLDDAPCPHKRAKAILAAAQKGAEE